MKKTLTASFGAVFAVALVLIPAYGLAKTHFADPLYVQCIAAYPTVSAGNAGRFTVVSNVPGPYQWVAEDYSIVDAGPVFVTPFEHAGPTQVDVVYGSIRSSCYVNVVAAPGYGERYTPPVFADQNYNYGNYGAYGPGPNVTIASVAYPFLPNTGFEPQTLAAFAFAVVLLLGAVIALYPHARKAFAIVAR
jgi:hypothetical protein